MKYIKEAKRIHGMDWFELRLYTDEGELIEVRQAPSEAGINKILIGLRQKLKQPR